MSRDLNYLRSSGHSRTRGRIADGISCLLLSVNYLDKIPKVTIVLDNYVMLVSAVFPTTAKETKKGY